MEEIITRTEKNLFLSFIVPVYNVENYLRDCLDSLLTQNVEKDEYEIICINDGSKDGSLAILREYEKEYKNVRVIDKENGGVSSARNAGLQAAQGEYIWFVDSDDCIKTNCLKQFKEFLAENKAECVKIQYKTVSENFVAENEQEELLSFEKMQGSISSSNVWCVITQKALITDNNLTFNTTMKYGEDTLFQYHIYMYMQNDNSYEIKIPLYYYRQRANSAMHKRDKESMTQRARDFLTMAYTYQAAYQNRISDDPVKMDNTLKRQHLAIKAFLTVLPATDLDYKDSMKQLKTDKLYPYPFLWWYLKTPKNWKWKLKEFFYLFFKWKFFYKIYYIVRRK